MLFHPLCYSKRALFKARKLRIFKTSSLRSTLSARRRSTLYLKSHRIPKSYRLHNASEGLGDRFILTFYTRFGSSQPPIFLEITTIASLTRETSAIIPKKLLKKELTYSWNTFYGSFYTNFCCHWGISCWRFH